MVTTHRDRIVWSVLPTATDAQAKAVRSVPMATDSTPTANVLNVPPTATDAQETISCCAWAVLMASSSVSVEGNASDASLIA